MHIRKSNILHKSVKISLVIGVATALGFSSALAGDALPLPENAKFGSVKLGDTVYEDALLGKNSNYPDVGLRKQVSGNCYCSGGYFSVKGGYALSPVGRLSKAAPVVINPGTFNEAVPSMDMSGNQITGSAAAGYKFENFRVELSGEYRRHNGWAGSITDGVITAAVSSKTNQYGALMSAFYDIEIPNMPITPYVGVGAGLALSNTQYNVSYTGGGTTTTGNVKYSRGASFMGAAMAGVAVRVTDNITLDVGYRFMNISGGDATYENSENAANLNAAAGIILVNPAGMSSSTDPITGIDTPEVLTYPSMLSHEINVGVRYSF